MQKFKSHPLFSNYVTVLTTLEAELYVKYQSRCVLQHWYIHYAIQSSNPFWTDMKVCSRCNKDGMYWPSLPFLLTGKFRSDTVTTRIYHTRGNSTAAYFSTTLKFFGSPRPSEMLQPLNHRSQREARQGERSRGDESQETTCWLNPGGVRVKTYHGLVQHFGGLFQRVGCTVYSVSQLSTGDLQYHFYFAFLCILAGICLRRCVFINHYWSISLVFEVLGDVACPQAVTAWISQWNF